MLNYTVYYLLVFYTLITQYTVSPADSIVCTLTTTNICNVQEIVEHGNEVMKTNCYHI